MNKVTYGEVIVIILIIASFVIAMSAIFTMSLDDKPVKELEHCVIHKPLGQYEMIDGDK